MTNFEAIKSMTTTEFIKCFNVCRYIKPFVSCVERKRQFGSCVKCMEAWLESEVEDEL